MEVKLNKSELDILFRQSPSTQSHGGFQSLLVNLQNKTDKATGILKLSDSDLERIRRYAFDYENGGWQGRLKGIFERHLGENLDRES